MDDSDKFPPSLLCPISGEVFEDPVFASDGHTYERCAIAAWLENHDTSPMTREHISPTLSPCYLARQMVDVWKEKLSAEPEQGQSTIPFEELQLGLGDLGYGSFKRVQKGLWKGMDVAVATVLDNDVVMADEVKVMRDVGRHPYILSLHGISRDAGGKEHLVQELAKGGSLSDALGDLADEDKELEPAVLLTIAQQVCEAMQAMAHAGLVHRDLAARNVLLDNVLDPSDPSSVSVKVSDFGLSKKQVDILTTASGGGDQMPLRYMPPEAIQRCKFSEKSDVWAFGVLLWELASLCQVPYQSLGVFVNDDKELKTGVCDGSLRLPRPPGCPSCVYDLMMSCWEAKQQARPTFRQLRLRIQEAAVSLQVSMVRKSPVAKGAPQVEISRGHASGSGGSPPSGTASNDLSKSRDLEDVQRRMQANPQDPDLQEFAARAIEDITRDTPTDQARAGDIGLLEDLAVAMRQHRAHVGLQEMACRAIQNITVNTAANRARAMQTGLLQDLAETLRQHRTHAGIQEHAASAVWSITLKTPFLQSKARALGLPAELRAAKLAHPNHEGVQAQTFGALGCIGA